MEGRIKVDEVSLATCLIETLRDQGFETYHEVSPKGGKRADVVAVGRDGKAHIFETKRGLGADVIQQAIHWREYASEVSVCVPEWSYKYLDVFTAACEGLGIGIVFVTWNTKRGPDGVEHRLTGIRWHIGPRPGIAPLDIKQYLCPEQKDVPPGNAEAIMSTPFTRTARLALEHVRKVGPCTPKALAAAIPHHYASQKSAYGALLRSARSGLFSGLGASFEGGAWRIVLKNSEAEEGLDHPSVF